MCVCVAVYNVFVCVLQYIMSLCVCCSRDEAHGVCRSYLKVWPESADMWQCLLDSQQEDVVSAQTVRTTSVYTAAS